MQPVQRGGGDGLGLSAAALLAHLRDPTSWRSAAAWTAVLAILVAFLLKYDAGCRGLAVCGKGTPSRGGRPFPPPSPLERLSPLSWSELGCGPCVGAPLLSASPASCFSRSECDGPGRCSQIRCGSLGQRPGLRWPSRKPVRALHHPELCRSP